MKSIVMKGFDAVSVMIESTVRKIGERLVEEGRRRDRGRESWLKGFVF
jgi:hypothetical protein